MSKKKLVADKKDFKKVEVTEIVCHQYFCQFPLVGASNPEEQIDLSLLFLLMLSTADNFSEGY